MTFCQKHSNHHCVHHHNCKDPNHNKKNAKNKKQLKSISSQHQLASIQQENQQCVFACQQQMTKIHMSSFINQKQEYLSKINILQMENIKLSRQHQKSVLENKHLQCQMDYLRSQLQKIVSNSTTDIKFQIQKHLEQNKNLCLRIKQLALQNQELSNKLIDKQNNMDSYRIQSNKYKKQRDEFSKKLKALQQKHEKQIVKSIQSNKKNANYQDINKEMQAKYAALSKQSQFTIQQFQSQIQQLKNQLQKVSKQNLKLKGKYDKNSELYQLDLNLWKQKETKLIDTISSLKQSLSNEQKNNKSLKQKIEVLQENYQHSKNIILKLKDTQNDQNSFNQATKLHQIQKSKPEFQNKTIPKLQSQKNSQEILLKYNQLQKQNFQLKTQLDQFTKIQRPLQTHNQNIHIQQCEQYILKIGASQAFKKIIEQKNKIITNLLKEKSKLYEKLFQNQEKSN